MKNNMTVRRGMTLKRKEALTGYLFWYTDEFLL